MTFHGIEILIVDIDCYEVGDKVFKSLSEAQWYILDNTSVYSVDISFTGHAKYNVRAFSASDARERAFETDFDLKGLDINETSAAVVGIARKA